MFAQKRKAVRFQRLQTALIFFARWSGFLPKLFAGHKIRRFTRPSESIVSIWFKQAAETPSRKRESQNRESEHEYRLQFFCRSRRAAGCRIAYRATGNARLQRYRHPGDEYEPSFRRVSKHPLSCRTGFASAFKCAGQLQNIVPARGGECAIQPGGNEFLPRVQTDRFGGYRKLVANRAPADGKIHGGGNSFGCARRYAI